MRVPTEAELNQVAELIYQRRNRPNPVAQWLRGVVIGFLFSQSLRRL